MPECTLCGKHANELTKVEVEGTVVDACDECKKFGKVVEVKVYKPSGRDLDLSRLGPDEDVITVPDYGKRVREAREKRGMNVREFASKINERESVIKRVESQSLEPDDELAKKLERALEIKLKERYE